MQLTHTEKQVMTPPLPTTKHRVFSGAAGGWYSARKIQFISAPPVSVNADFDNSTDKDTVHIKLAGLLLRHPLPLFLVTTSTSASHTIYTGTFPSTQLHHPAMR